MELSPMFEKLKLSSSFRALRQSKKFVRRFVGLASYCRCFIDHFADVASPLHALTRASVKFLWSEDCEQAFSVLKSRLTSPPVPAYRNFQHEFTVYRC